MERFFLQFYSAKNASLLRQEKSSNLKKSGKIEKVAQFVFIVCYFLSNGQVEILPAAERTSPYQIGEKGTASRSLLQGAMQMWIFKYSIWGEDR